jgi:AraC-like DNA-binding protein
MAIRRQDLAGPSILRVRRFPLLEAEIERPGGVGSEPSGLVGDVLNLLDLAHEGFERDDEASKAAIFQATFLLRSALQRSASWSSAEDDTGALSAPRVQLVRAYVEEHLAEPVHIDNLSGAVGLSRSYFCRAFKRTFGQTAHAYVVSRRISRAKTLMLDGQSLSEIALLCGFSDQAHFSNLFREQTGESPAAWRRRRSAGDTDGHQLGLWAPRSDR